MKAEVTDLVQENGTVSGLRAKAPREKLEIRAGLTVAADGRHSTVRKPAEMKVINLGAPMDVLGMRISRRPTDPGLSFARIDAGRMLVMLDRQEYWQCAYVIPKGTIEEIRSEGIAFLRQDIAPATTLSCGSRRRTAGLERH
jgi:2-polyprenyl-6-methoxyphenol hydroxylase-like FAD-dependent oxidoreductase